MKNNMKLGLGLLTVLATPIAVNAVDGHEVQAATGWVQRAGTWYHYNNNGALTRNAWVGNYWLGADGKMVTNAWVDNNRYFVGSNGAWVKNAQKPAEVKKGWVQNGASWYHYNNNGALTRNAWVGNYWLGADGKMVTNAWVDNNRYYVGNNGAWVKNAQRPVEVKKGWVKEGNAWYFYNDKGQMVKNAWAGNYWLGADGKMVTNAWVDNNRYYVGSNGAWEKDAKRETPTSNKKGWVKEENAWYFYNDKGQMVKNAWAGNYWLGANGKMVTNAWVDGGRYYVDATGKWVNKNATSASTNTPALNMPQYYQGDARWGSKRYGISTMRNTGCVPTSLAMVFTGLGKSVTPTQVADTIYYNTNEFNKRELGTSGAGADYAVRYYGFNNSIIQSKEQLIDALKKGYPVFAAMGNGYFVKGNHYTHAVVLSGYQNGKTKAMDPDNAYTTQKWYDINKIWNQRSLEPSDTVMGGSFMSIGKK